MSTDSSIFTGLKNYIVKSTYTSPLSEHMNSIIVWNPPNLREMLYKGQNGPLASIVEIFGPIALFAK